MQNSEKILTQSDEQSILDKQMKQQYTVQIEQKQQNVKYVSKPEELVGLITHQIQSEIQHSAIQISNESKPFEIILKETSRVIKNDKFKSDQKKIADLVKQRKSLEEQITRLKFEREQQKKNSRSKSPKQNSTQKHFRSQFTQRQHMQISRIIKESQQFQHHLQEKNKQIEDKVAKQRQKQLQQRKKQIEELKQRKKEQAQKKILKIQQEQKHRWQRLREQNKKYQSVKKIKTFHEKIQEKQKQLLQMKRNQQKQFLMKHRKSKQFHFEQIKQHEKKYYETVRMSKQKIQNQLVEKVKQMKQNQSLLSQTYRPSKFLMTLWSQQKQKQEEDIRRIEELKLLYTKKNLFQQQLRDIHKEKIKTKPTKVQKSVIQTKTQIRSLKAKSMSAAEIYKQGQQYMKSVHSSISPVLVQQSKIQLDKNYKQIREGSKTHYRNYLQESKIRRQTMYKSVGQLHSKQNPQMHQLSSLINNKKQKPTQKLYKAKLIAQKLDQKAKNASANALVNSITAKLKIIEEFS